MIEKVEHLTYLGRVGTEVDVKVLDVASVLSIELLFEVNE